MAFFAAFSEAICAAKGVDFFEPLKPADPDDSQQTQLPPASVIVMIVLLKLAAMCATPRTMCLIFFFFAISILYLGDEFGLFRRGRPFSQSAHGFAFAFARTRVRMGPLPAARKALQMPRPTIAADIHQALDIHLDLAAKIPLDLGRVLDDRRER
jgi:hypothetical protein